MDAYITCPCNHCSGNIEFPGHGAGEEIECPHCGMTTVLFKPVPIAQSQLPSFQIEPPKPPLLPGRELVRPEPERFDPPIVPCKACKRSVAIMSDSCVHCGQLWPGFTCYCPRCKANDFQIMQESGPLLLIPATPVGVAAYAIFGWFMNQRRLETWLHCRICGADYVPDKS